MGRGDFYTFEGGWIAGEMGRVDRKEGGGGNWEGDFTDGMLRWRYFSRATLSHPASIFYILADGGYEINQPRAWENPNVGANEARLINDNNDVFYSVNKAMKHLD